LDAIWLFVSIFQSAQAGAVLTFTGNVLTDLADIPSPVTALPAELPTQTGPRWGSVGQGGTGERWGTPGEGGTGAIWTAVPAIQGLYFALPILSPLSTGQAKIIQMEFSESSIYGWSILGYALQVDKTEAVA